MCVHIHGQTFTNIHYNAQEKTVPLLLPLINTIRLWLLLFSCRMPPLWEVLITLWLVGGGFSNSKNQQRIPSDHYQQIAWPQKRYWKLCRCPVNDVETHGFVRVNRARFVFKQLYYLSGRKINRQCFIFKNNANIVASRYPRVFIYIYIYFHSNVFKVSKTMLKATIKKEKRHFTRNNDARSARKPSAKVSTPRGYEIQIGVPVSFL